MLIAPRLGRLHADMLRLVARNDRHIAAVFAAIYALLIHAVVSVGVATPAFQIICSGAGFERTVLADQSPGQHREMPQCCLAGCPLAGGSAALPTLIGPVFPDRVDVPCKFAVEAFAAAGGAYRPGNPRGPPAAA
jgi:hypothetical protein